MVAFWLGAGMADAYIRIVVNGKTLNWSSNQITWNFQADGLSSIPTETLQASLEHSFQSWQDVDQSAISFVRGPDTTSRSISGSTHMVMFDESNESGWFPTGTTMLAVTPISYRLSDGRILDADIVFNARDYQWSTDATPGTLDVQNVMTHEVGHLIGLDHTPIHGGTMWPYAQAGMWTQRSLSFDDELGAVAIAKEGNISLLTGHVLRTNGNPVRGALVCAVLVSDGRFVASAATDGNGKFVIKGLPMTDYFVYATPMEGGMSSANLSGNQVVETDFSFSFYGSFSNPTSFSVAGSTTTDIGNLSVPNDSSMRDNFGVAQVFEQGEQKMFSVFGNQFDPGDMVASELSPYIVVDNTISNASQVNILLTVSPSCPPGLYDIFLSAENGEYEAIPGAIEVAAPEPEVFVVTPDSGETAGGNEVQLDGAHFQVGAWVLVGGREAAQVAVFDSNTIGIVTPQGEPGWANIRVVNPDGRQHILEESFLFSSVPILAGLIPKAGQASGGTEVMIVGSGFAPGLAVSFGGVAASVAYLSPSLIRVTTPTHPLGVVDLDFTNPDGAQSQSPQRFTFVSEPDPSLHSFTPDTAQEGGGTEVRLFGRNFPVGTRIKFGVDPVTGQGGHFAAGVQVLSSREISSFTPSAVTAGTYGVVAELPNGQAVLATATFSFDSTLGSGSGSSGGLGGGGGGGCAGVVGLGLRPALSWPGFFQGLVGTWPPGLLVLLSYLFLRRRN